MTNEWTAILLGIAGGLIVLATAVKVVIIPFFRALWQAVLSASQIRDDLGELKELLRADILNQLKAYAASEAKHSADIENLKDQMRLIQMVVAVKKGDGDGSS